MFPDRMQLNVYNAISEIYVCSSSSNYSIHEYKLARSFDLTMDASPASTRRYTDGSDLVVGGAFHMTCRNSQITYYNILNVVRVVVDKKSVYEKYILFR